MVAIELDTKYPQVSDQVTCLYIQLYRHVRMYMYVYTIPRGPLASTIHSTQLIVNVALTSWLFCQHAWVCYILHLEHACMCDNHT